MQKQRRKVNQTLSRQEAICKDRIQMWGFNVDLKKIKISYKNKIHGVQADEKAVLPGAYRRHQII